MSLSLVTTYNVLACAECGALFAVPEQVQREWRNSGATFYCPNGHRQHYANSTEKQLRETKDRLAREQARNDQLRAERDAESRRASAARGQVTKIKRRVGRGVCPCCNRTFANLADHMASQHPSFVENVDGTSGGVTG